VKVDCDFKKWGDVQHYRFAMEPLGRDDHGVWLASRAPNTVTAGPRAPFEMHHTFVTVLPADGWWIASFYTAPTELDIYVDIATPARWVSETHVTSVDLDLDVVRYRADGRVELADEDEFGAHRVAYGYPDDIVQTARETAARIIEAITDGREPFRDAGFTWLAKL
jgi:hypothetical protein